MNDLGLNIKLKRLDSNLSQVDLAHILGVSQTSIAHYEKGTRQPSIETLVLMSQLFNVSIEVLIGVEKANSVSHNSKELKDYIYEMKRLLIDKEEDKFIRVFNENIEDKYPIEVILYDVLQPILYYVGTLWEKGDISEADEHYATNVIRKVLHHLSYKQSANIKSKSVVSYAISSEKHTIGLEILNTLLQYNGIDTIYLGSDVPFEAIVETIDNHKPHSVLISVTIGSYLNGLSRHVKDLVKRYGNDLEIFIGGQGVLNNDYLLDIHNVTIIRNNTLLVDRLTSS